jgi:hypothetical protein
MKKKIKIKYKKKMNLIRAIGLLMRIMSQNIKQKEAIKMIRNKVKI